MAEKRPTYNTPVGVFDRFPKIASPDFKFKTEGEFTLKLILPTDNPIAMKMRGLADKIAKEKLESAVAEAKPADKKKLAIKNSPYADEVDEEGNETGRTVFKFTMKHSGVSKKTGKPWKMWPRLFDAQNKAIPRDNNADYDLKVWGGSEGCIRFETIPYATVVSGAGCKFSLVAVQITKLVEGGGGDDGADYGFGKQDGGFESTDSDAPTGGDDEDGDAAPSTKTGNGSADENDDF